jgi:hypothetical protein
MMNLTISLTALHLDPEGREPGSHNSNHVNIRNTKAPRHDSDIHMESTGSGKEVFPTGIQVELARDAPIEG